MRLPHLLPFAAQPLLFLTTCTHDRRPLLAHPIALSVLTEIWTRSLALDGWSVGRFVIMPDHVHFFARAAPDAKPLAAWMRTWKSLSARQLTASLTIEPPIWQRDYFDHFLRSADSYSEKWEYVRNNPVRQGLAAAPDAWPYQGELHALQF